MMDEIQSLMRNKTWEEARLPPGRTAVKSKWVFRVKKKANGELDKYKARLVAKGFSQKYKIDYEETFAPVVRYTSIRLLLGLAAELDLEIDQMDVVTAFLNSKLSEDIYMKLPNDDFLKGKIVKLKRSIYGLKQAPFEWNKTLDAIMKSLKFKTSNYDPCIYYKKNKEKILIIAVYVDDLLIFSNDTKMKNEVKKALMDRLKMKDLGQAHYILGMKITRDRKNGIIYLDQEKYIKNMLERFNMTDCKPVSTPMDQILSKDMQPKTKNEKEKMEDVPYMEAVGSLIHASQCTRPDIAQAVASVSRYNKNPGPGHWTAVKRIFRYLKGTASKKLVFRKTGSFIPLGYCDSNWGNDLDDGRSTSGYVFLLGGCSVSWGSKKQACVALSTCEAEYMSSTMASQEALWLKWLLEELLGTSLGPIEILCDNKGAIDLAKTSQYKPRTKHIALRHHFIRECIKNGNVKISKIDTENMVADFLTKPLAKEKFTRCINKLGLQSELSGS